MAAIWAADHSVPNRSVANMIEGMKNLTPGEKEKVKKEIQRLLDATRFPWPHIVGLCGDCDLWLDKYNNNTGQLKTRLQEEMKQYFQINNMHWDTSCPLWLAIPFAAGGGHPYEAWAELGAGHSAIQITFADGTILYLDDGNLGGVDHVFVPSQVPSNYHPCEGFPIPFKK